jgi:hypothetical protein
MTIRSWSVTLCDWQLLIGYLPVLAGAASEQNGTVAISAFFKSLEEAGSVRCVQMVKRRWFIGSRHASKVKNIMGPS